MDSKDFAQHHFESIQALRGIASLFIVLEHIRFLNCGAFCVDIFFCISGFMAMLSTEKSSRKFLQKRLLRILPLYYLMTGAAYLLLLLFPAMFANTQADPLYLLKSLLFIPFDIGGGALQPLLRIGWTINCEMFFYLLFFFSLKISQKYRGLLCALFLTCLCLAAALVPDPPVFLAFYGAPVMLEFLYGMACYEIVRRLYARCAPREHTASAPSGKAAMPLSLVCALLAIGCFALLLLTKPRINILGYRRPIVWGLPALVIVLCFFAMELSLRFPKPLVSLGNISFSLYLLHYYPTQFLDRAVFHFDACTPFTLLGTALCLAVSICLAAVCHELMEKRFHKFLSKKLNL